jgi:hypothetical protein
MTAAILDFRFDEAVTLIPPVFIPNIYPMSCGRIQYSAQTVENASSDYVLYLSLRHFKVDSTMPIRLMW